MVLPCKLHARKGVPLCASRSAGGHAAFALEAVSPGSPSYREISRRSTPCEPAGFREWEGTPMVHRVATTGGRYIGLGTTCLANSLLLPIATTGPAAIRSDSTASALFLTHIAASPVPVQGRRSSPLYHPWDDPDDQGGQSSLVLSYIGV